MTFQWSFKFILVDIITKKKQFCNIFLSIGEDSTVILRPPQPMKFMTTRWRMTLAKIKSANALSGEIPLKSDMLAGLLWTRRQTRMKTKDKINIIPEEFKQCKVLRSHYRKALLRIFGFVCLSSFQTKIKLSFKCITQLYFRP